MRWALARIITLLMLLHANLTAAILKEETTENPDDDLLDHLKGMQACVGAELNVSREASALMPQQPQFIPQIDVAQILEKSIKRSADSVTLTFRPENSDELKNIFSYFRSNPELAAKITNIDIWPEITLNEALDFSIFPNIETIAIKRVTLSSGSPIIKGCKKLRAISLVSCTVTKFPELDGNESLKVIHIDKACTLSEAAVTQARNTWRNKIGDFVIRADALGFETASNLSSMDLSNKSLIDLVEAFAQAVDKPDKSYLDVGDVRVIAQVFYIDHIQSTFNLWGEFRENIDGSAKAQVKRLLQEARDNPIFQTKLIVLEYYCRLFQSTFALKKLENWDVDFNIGASPWLPDLSFMSRLPPVQPPLGKPRLEGYIPPFPKSMLVPMRPFFWTHDASLIYQTKYLSATEKKPIKMRQTDQPFIFSRGVDAGQKIANGEYIYVLSPNGGFYVTNSKEWPEDSLKHSSVRAGQYVMCAGVMQIENGKIISIDNGSGHMTPPFKNLICAAVWLHKQGYIDEKCMLRNFEGENQITVGDLIARKDTYIEDKEALEYVNEVLAGKHAKPPKKWKPT